VSYVDAEGNKRFKRECLTDDGKSPGASPAASARPCDPPYSIDSAGHRQYKPECL
jgi:hypothetical protein